eukprot:6194417-Pleurochrysis_carterae.AAC.2
MELLDSIKALQPHTNDLEQQQYSSSMARCLQLLRHSVGWGHKSYEGKIAPIAARLGQPSGGRTVSRRFAFEAAVDSKAVF